MPKPRLPMSHIYADVASEFNEAGNMRPSHCDVRCAVNDYLDTLDRDGFKVNFGYSQDRAFRSVRKILLRATGPERT